MGSEKKGNTKMRCLFFSFGQYLMYIFGFKITYEVKGLIFCKLLSSSSFGNELITQPHQVPANMSGR